MDETRELDEAERAFGEWRRNKRTKEIPEQLWARAVRVASVHGLTRTATRLRLNATRLKERCEGEVSGGGFVELAASELKLGDESVVEIEDAAGARLRLVLRGASLAAVTAAAKELWSATR
jgi:hypothetical protein